MRRDIRLTFLATATAAGVLIGSMTTGAEADAVSWTAPTRAAKVAALTPGRKIPNLTPERLFADWCRQQVEKWTQANPGETIEATCERYANSSATGAPQRTEKLASFESDADLPLGLTVQSGCTIQRVQQHATDGAWSLRVEIPGSEKDTWPGILLKGEGQPDWSSRQALMLDIFLDGDAETGLGARLDADKEVWCPIPTLKPGLNKDLIVGVAAVKEKVDLKQVKTLLLYIGQPRRNYVFYVDNVRWVPRQSVATAPSDRELTEDFPEHISPFARVRSGTPTAARAQRAMTGSGEGYCPLCGSASMDFKWDPANAYHATTSCCHRELYGRAQDYPSNYDLTPNATATFAHLDGTVKDVPCLIQKDPDGVEWELFIPTLFAHRRWLALNQSVVTYGRQFKETADPLYAYKIAVLLDKTADTYYGLPLSAYNELANGKDGNPLTRAEWEGVEEVNVFQATSLGIWNRRTPVFNRGWINMSNEHIWVEPFARVRHHPAFKSYSKKLYGDPEALDRKIMTKLVAEVARAFRTIFSQKLLCNYQEANYYDMILTGVLAGDRTLVDFAVPNQELTLYNHHYQDGLNGEGAANYMAMLNSYYYPFLRDPKSGWTELYPDFFTDHPFFETASAELNKLRTVRNLELEFADEHEYTFSRGIVTDAAKVAEREAIPSMNWPGWGVGILRFGGAGHRQEMTLMYTRTSLHSASDTLGIACWVDGVPVMRPGGYAHHPIVPLDFTRPEIKGLNAMGYPHEIIDAQHPWSWDWAHSPLAQNTVTVDEAFTSMGWADKRGFGEVVTFKGGEASGDAGAHFQVLDVRDRFSFDRVGVKVSDLRRALLGVEGPDGRPYAVDILSLRGGSRHALYQSAWGERAEDALPPVTGTENDLTKVMFANQQKAVVGDVAFPKEWLVFGPGEQDTPEPDAEALAAVQPELAWSNMKLLGQKAALADNRIDLGALLGGKQSGKTAYLLAEIEVAKDTEITIGAGADWWMKWWVNGAPIGDTLADGNKLWPPQISDYLFRAKLKKGKNTLAVKAISGSGSFVLAAGGPQELRKLPKLPSGLPPKQQVFERVRNVERLAPPSGNWDLTWKTDVAAYAVRDPKGEPFKRPIPEDAGRVRLRLIGVAQPDMPIELMRGKGPWVAVINQPLETGNTLHSNVGFRDATDFLVERRELAENTTAPELTSRFVHVMEGYREGEASTIRRVELLPVVDSAGTANAALGLRVELLSGVVDTVIFQPEGGKVEFKDGTTTDARYALVRRNAGGEVVEAHMVRGTYLRGAGLDVTGAAEYTGTIVDLIGDLTGTRQESALIVKPDAVWPEAPGAGCQQMLIEGPNPLRTSLCEVYAIAGVKPMPGNQVRVDLANHAPLVAGWHQVTLIDPKKPNVLKTNRPLTSGSNSPWYWGMKAWFPERGVTAVIKGVATEPDAPWNCTTLTAEDGFDLAAKGIQPGDWFVVHFLEPGLKVTLPNAVVWRK
ncbi:MAG: hypothetical protein A3K19_14670 [Lentisphaerae bacterium RIFOXYB12_FULL_65_16]|nr:MAG: hypothetical protein A3K18_28735 [Lentisphaerae bacterium RIFOXYA12_64_32]OGV87466.1 MAG: hypothetical protein A3K19_14670 [Lentisphaerae bacterium RIFOXYB12_FULL_65_16]